MTAPLRVLARASTDGRVFNCIPLARADSSGAVYAAWDGSKHPRHPAGTEDGGEFAPAGVTLDGTFYHAPTKGSFNSPSVDIGSDFDIMGKGFYFGTKAVASDYGVPLEFKLRGKFATGDAWVKALAPYSKLRTDSGRRKTREDLIASGFSGVWNGRIGVVWDQRALEAGASFIAFVSNDYSAIGPRLDALEASGVASLRAVLVEVTAALESQIRNAKDTAGLRALVADLRPRRRSALRDAVLELMRRAWDAGSGDAWGEVTQVREHAEEDGVWRTINGRRVFIRSGEDVDTALARSLAPKDEWGISKKLDFKPTNAQLKIEADNLEDYARKSLDSWILLGQSDKYQAVMDRVRRLRAAMTIRGMIDRKLYLENYEQRDFAPRPRTTSSFIPRPALQWLRQKAFYISDILGDKILADAKGMILNAIKTGRTTQDVLIDLAVVLLPYLGDPAVVKDDEQLTPHRLETIVRTNTTEAYNHGRLTTFVDPEVLPFVDWIRYSAILDTRTTEVCRYLHMKLFRPEASALEELLPPNHFNCRSIVVPVVVGETVDMKDVITAAQIGRAKSLADAKFLTERGAWKNYAAGDSAEDEAEGVWRTINGRRVFIKKGESADDAMRRSLEGESKDGDISKHADAIAAMPASVRDNMEIRDFPGGADAYNLYEARKVLPKPSDKLKKITDSNSFSLWQDYSHIANVAGVHFGISKYEDPDEPDDDSKFVFAFQRLDRSSRGGMTETIISEVPELFTEMRKHL